MKKAIALILVLVMVLVLCACGGKPSVKGRWTTTAREGTYTLTITDNVITFQLGNETRSFECSILDDSHLKVSSGYESEIWPYSVNGDTMRLTVNDITETWYRIS